MKKKYNKKKILIIGKNGFFAKSFEKFFKDYDLKLIGREKDLSTINFKSVNIIINCAADIYNENEMFSSNTLLIYKILKNYLKQKSKAKIIHFGSSGEYGKSDNIISEKNLPNPSSVYAGTKAAGTLILQAFSKQFKIPSVILRSFTVYGPFENTSRILPFIFRHLLLNNKLTIYKGYHDYLYIDDLCKMIKKLINNWNIKNYGDIVNIGSGKQYSNKKILKICENITKIKASAKFSQKFNRSSHNKHYNYEIKENNPSKRRGLKLYSKTSLKNGIKKYWKNLLNNDDLRTHTMKYKNKFFTEWKN